MNISNDLINNLIAFSKDLHKYHELCKKEHEITKEIYPATDKIF